MNTIITKTWKFRTIRIKGTCKCSKCGKSITKSFSLELREDVPTTNEHIKELEIERDEWLKESHICNACKKKKIEQERKNLTNNFTEQFSKLHEYQLNIQEIIQNKSSILDDLKEQLRDKIIVYNEKEYVIDYVHDGYQNGCAFEIWCSPISKTRPWLETSGSVCFYQKAYRPVNFNNFIEIENCTITDEDFTKRRQLLDAE